MTRLDNLEAKCQYCGSKMESLLSSLQEEVTELPNLSPEAENTIYLSIAGLKHVGGVGLGDGWSGGCGCGGVWGMCVWESGGCGCGGIWEMSGVVDVGVGGG